MVSARQPIGNENAHMAVPARPRLALEALFLTARRSISPQRKPAPWFSGRQAKGLKVFRPALTS